MVQPNFIDFYNKVVKITVNLCIYLNNNTKPIVFM